MSRPRLPNIKTPDDFSGIDRKLLVHMADTPGWTYESAGEYAGCCPATAWEHIRNIRKSTWVESMHVDFERLAPKILRATAAGLDDSAETQRATVAMRLASGLGVLVDKQQHSIKLEDASPQQIADAIVKMSDEQLADAIARREAAERDLAAPGGIITPTEPEPGA